MLGDPQHVTNRVHVFAPSKARRGLRIAYDLTLLCNFPLELVYLFFYARRLRRACGVAQVVLGFGQPVFQRLKHARR